MELRIGVVCQRDLRTDRTFDASLEREAEAGSAHAGIADELHVSKAVAGLHGGREAAAAVPAQNTPCGEQQQYRNIVFGVQKFVIMFFVRYSSISVHFNINYLFFVTDIFLMTRRRYSYYP